MTGIRNGLGQVSPTWALITSAQCPPGSPFSLHLHVYLQRFLLLATVAAIKHSVASWSGRKVTDEREALNSPASYDNVVRFYNPYRWPLSTVGRFRLGGQVLLGIENISLAPRWAETKVLKKRSEDKMQNGKLSEADALATLQESLGWNTPLG